MITLQMSKMITEDLVKRFNFFMKKKVSELLLIYYDNIYTEDDLRLLTQKLPMVM